MPPHFVSMTSVRMFITLIGNKIPFAVLILPHRGHLETGEIFLGRAAQPDAFLVEPAAMTGADQDAFLFLVVKPTAQMGAFPGNGPRPGLPDKEDKIMFQDKAAHRHDLVHLHYARLPGGAVAEKAENRIQQQGAGTPAQPGPGAGQKYPPGQRLFLSLRRISHAGKPSFPGPGPEG